MGQEKKFWVLPALVATFCLLISAQGGTFYTFGLFAADLKYVGNYTETQINLVGGSAYFGAMILMLPSGSLALKYPFTITLVGNGCNILGWLGLFLSVWFAPVSCWWVALSIALVGFGVSAVGPLALMLLKSQFETEKAKDIMETAFIALYALSGCIGALIYGSIESGLDTLLRLQVFMASQLVFTLIVVVLYTVIASRKGASGDGESEAITLSFIKAMRVYLSSPSVWLVLIINFALFGICANFYNNGGPIVLSLGASPDIAYYIFVVFCVAQLVGRISSGGLLFLLKLKLHKGISMTLLVVLMCAITTLVAICAGSYDSEVVYWFYACANAFTYGSLWYLIFILSDSSALLGNSSISFFHSYGILALSPAFGPFVFNIISGVIYDHYADPDTHLCYGQVCYRWYFIITAIVMCFVLCLSIFLVFLTWRKLRKSILAESVEEIASINTE